MKLLKFLISISLFFAINGKMNSQIVSKAYLDHVKLDGLDTLGNINLTVTGGTSPYSYTWNPGALSTKDYTDAVIGTYTAIIKDNASNTRTCIYKMGYKTNWFNFYGAKFHNDSLVSNGVSGFTNRTALTKNTLPANTDGWCQFILPAFSSPYLIGFLDSAVVSNQGDHYDLDFAFHLTYGNAFYAWSGGNWHYLGTAVEGDIIRIERVGSTFTLYKNNTSVRTAAATASKKLKIKGLIGTQPLGNIGVSFSDTSSLEKLSRVHAEIVHQSIYSNDSYQGNIKLSIRGGTLPYTYLWLPGSLNTPHISNLAIDTYTLKLKDAANDSLLYNYKLGYKTDWYRYYGVFKRNDTLMSDGTTISGNRACVSKNTLPANTNGWFQYIATESTNSLTIGFTDSTSVSSYNDYNDIDYGIRINNTNSLSVRANGTWSAISTVKSGDVLRVEREGNNYKLYKNNSAVHSNSLALSHKKLKVKVSTQSDYLANLGVSFNDTSAIDKLRRLVPIVNHIIPDDIDSNGDIKLQFDGGEKPIQYLIKPGYSNYVPGANLAKDSYTLIVKDAKGDSLEAKVKIGYKSHWEYFYGSINRNDTLMPDGVSWYDVKTAVSKNILRPNTDGWAEMIVYPVSENPWVLGFLDSVIAANQGDHYDIDFGVHVTTNFATWVWNGSWNYIGTSAVGDVLRIERISNTFYLKKNGTTVYSQAGINKSLKVKGHINNSQLINVGLSFADSTSTQAMKVFASVEHIVPDGKDTCGNISLRVSGGKSPYQYTWSPENISTKNRSNLAAGTYTLKIKDYNNDSLKYVYNIGYKTLWPYLYGTIARNDSILIDTAGVPDGSPTARTINHINSSTDGWCEMVIPKFISPYVVGFLDSVSVTSPGLWTDIDFGFHLTTGNYLYALYQGNWHYLGLVSEGEVLKLSREGSTFYLRKNGVSVFSVSSTTNKKFEIKTYQVGSYLFNIGTSGNVPFIYSFEKEHADYTVLNNGVYSVGSEFHDRALDVFWNDGVKQNFRTDLSPGNYTVNIIDNVTTDTLRKAITIGVTPYWNIIENLGASSDSTWAIQRDSIGLSIASNIIEKDSIGWYELRNTSSTGDLFFGFIGLESSEIDTSYSIPVYADSIIEPHIVNIRQLTSLAINNNLPYDVNDTLDFGGTNFNSYFLVRAKDGIVSLLLNKSKENNLFSYSPKDVLRIGRGSDGKIYFARNDSIKFTSFFNNSNYYLYPTVLTSKSAIVKGSGIISNPAGNTLGPLLDIDATCGADNNRNWRMTRTFKEYGKIVDEAIQYYDNFGRPTQTQQKVNSIKNILVSEVIYDSYGRQTGQTMSAPKYGNVFCYSSLFFANPSNAHYSVDDHDVIPTINNSSGERNNPKEVNNSYKGNLGWYYSNNNNLEPNVAADRYPYMRTVFSDDPLNRPIKSSGVGIHHKMGSRHESMIVYATSGTELEKIYFNSTYELDDSFNPLVYPAAPTMPNNVTNVYKTIQYNADGHDYITYTTPGGKVLATCVTGDDSECPGSIVQQTIPSNSFVIVHLPKTQLGTLKFNNTLGASYTQLIMPIIKLYNTKKVLTIGTDFNANTDGNGNMSITFIGNYTNDDLFLEISYYLNTSSPPANMDVFVKYYLGYTQWNVNYYDVKGRLKATQAPNNVACGEQPIYVGKVVSGNSISCDKNQPVGDFTIQELTPGVSPPEYKSMLISFEPEFNMFDTLVTLYNSSDFKFESNDTIAPYDSVYFYNNGYNDTIFAQSPKDSILYQLTGIPDSIHVSNLNQLKNEISREFISKSLSIKGKFYYSMTKNGSVVSYSNNPIPFEYELILDGDNAKVIDYGDSKIIFSTEEELEDVTAISFYTDSVKVKLKGFNLAPKNYISPCDTSMFVDSLTAQIVSNLNNNLTLMFKVSANQLPTAPPPAATFAKKFYYNEYDHLVATESADEGRTDFIYDLKEDKLLFSQNDKQRANGKKFNYIRYDNLGRVVESGEYDPTKVNNLTSFNYTFQPYSSYVQNGPPANPFLLSTYQMAINNTDISYITTTNQRFTQQHYISYDKANIAAVNLAGSSYAQKHTQGKVSATWNANTTTYYSYNERGELLHTVNYLAGYEAKTMEYFYDFRGNLTKTVYQRNNSNDVLSHEYTYDSDERLLTANFRLGTASNSDMGPIASYSYYQHGPLKRKVIGRNIQGLDYIYTLNGSLKSINNPVSNGNNTLDPGYDGLVNSLPVDMYALGLEYYYGDYVRNNSLLNNTKVNSAYNDLNVSYTGLVHAQRWYKATDPGNGNSVPSPNISGYLMYEYKFDELYRLIGAQFCNYTINNPQSGGDPYTLSTTPLGQYKLQNMSYDRNGNLQTIKRYAEKTTGQVLMDDLTYNYHSTLKNRLNYVTDAITTNNGFNTETDFANQSNTSNYAYNQIGELNYNVQDDQKYEYNNGGLVSVVRKNSDNKKIVEFTYNEHGLRNTKTNFNSSGNPLTKTWYVYNAAGALIAFYEQNVSVQDPGAPVLAKWVMYGQGREGLLDKTSKTIDFELSDQVGNVRMVLQDAGTIGTFPGTPVLKQSTDYYPHGGPLPGRNYVSGTPYLFAVQGQEKDAETGLTNFELRQMDPRLGRWLNPDPYGQHNSPYLSMSNNPVNFVDPNGGWDNTVGGVYDPSIGLSYTQWISQKENSGAFSQSESERDWAHMSGSMGGGVNADGSFYSQQQQIYDAQINNLLYNHEYIYVNGEFIGSATTYGYSFGYDANGKPNEDEKGASMEVYAVTYSKSEIFAAYGINEDFQKNGLLQKGHQKGWDNNTLQQYGKGLNEFGNAAVKFTYGATAVILTAGVAAEYISYASIVNIGSEAAAASEYVQLKTYAYINGAYNKLIQTSISNLLRTLPKTGVSSATLKRVADYLSKNQDKTREISKDTKKLLELYRRMDKISDIGD